MEIFTDGVCSGNPGPEDGARCAPRTHERELYGGESTQTTNNRRELMAPIQTLETLTRPSTVLVYTDRVPRWKSNGWRTGNRGRAGSRPSGLVGQHEQAREGRLG